MELIWLLAAITFLSQHSTAYYIKTTTFDTWADVRNECTLATPTIKYSPDELTVDLGTELNLHEGEELWVGYIKDFEIYLFHGCINQSYLARQDAHVIKASVGMCYSVCPNTRIVGVTKKNDNTTLCYCVNNSYSKNMNNTKTLLRSCDSQDEKGLAFGIEGLLAVYERVSTTLSEALKALDTWDNTASNCLCFYDPSKADFRWFLCAKYVRYLCANSTEGLRLGQDDLPWMRAVDMCLKNSAFPLHYHLNNSSFNSTNQFWLANVKSMTIAKDKGQKRYNSTKYGYIMRKNSKLILRFKEPNGINKGLCSEDATDVDRPSIIITDRSNLQNVAGVDTTSKTTTDRSNLLNTTDLYQMLDDSSSLFGMYVGVSVVIVLVVIVIGTVILLRRKRRASPKKIDNTKKNLTYESNTQPNQNIKTHRPDSVEAYHEIQDITESTNEGYDTIPDGYLHISTQNNNNDVAYFVLEKHDNADYEFAKEVIGETEHVYDRKPINTTLAVTDDYDHIGKGNAVLKQSLEDQPYDTTSGVKQKYQDPTYDHTGDHTTYDHTWNHHDHTGDHSAYDHTGDNADYDHAGNHNSYDHNGDEANYDHTGDQTNYDDDSAYDRTKDQSDKTDFKV